MSHKTYFNWSTGKDSSLALHYLLQDDRYQIAQLLTSVNSHHNRISMHGLRRSLLEIQAKSIGIPLTTIELPEEPSMETYNSIMSNKMSELRAEGFTHTAFGDIFLEDLRKYREEKLNELNIKALFPLWKRNTTELMTEFLGLGFKTIVVCINEAVLDKSFVGRVIDQKFLEDLPSTVDPCGENGEFHTFCFDGPIFSKPVEFEIGEIVHKTYPSPKKDSKNDLYGFWFCDLIPKN
jgi:uncharacterized protein (TIGR00290 family)